MTTQMSENAERAMRAAIAFTRASEQLENVRAFRATVPSIDACTVTWNDGCAITGYREMVREISARVTRDWKRYADDVEQALVDQVKITRHELLNALNLMREV